MPDHNRPPKPTGEKRKNEAASGMLCAARFIPSLRRSENTRLPLVAELTMQQPFAFFKLRLPAIYHDPMIKKR